VSEKDTSKSLTDNEKDFERSVKSHDEIVSLINDIDKYERELDEVSTPFPSFPQEIEEPLTYHDLTPETTVREITEKDLPPGKTTLRLRWRKKAKQEKTKRHFKQLFKRQPQHPSDKDSLKKRLYYGITGSSEPVSTFTLKLDEEGNLTGFNIKEPTPSFKTIVKTFGTKVKGRLSRKSKGESEGEPEEKKGIKGKLAGIVKRGKKSSEGEGEKTGRFSGIGSKIKGVIPKRGKKEE